MTVLIDLACIAFGAAIFLFGYHQGRQHEREIWLIRSGINPER